MYWLTWLWVGLIAGWLIEFVILSAPLSSQTSVPAEIIELSDLARSDMSNILVRDGTTQAINDPLQEINGIRAVYEQRPNAADIDTFWQLIETGAQRLYKIAAPQVWQKIDASDWIIQAQEILAVHP